MNKNTILLIDDEKIIRETGRAMIEVMGYKCIIAANGRDGIKKFKDSYKDILLILLDVEMPDMKGDEVYEILKREFKDIKILFTSGYGKDYLEKKVFGRKVENFIPKPLSVTELSIKFEQILEN